MIGYLIRWFFNYLLQHPKRYRFLIVGQGLGNIGKFAHDSEPYSAQQTDLRLCLCSLGCQLGSEQGRLEIYPCQLQPSDALLRVCLSVDRPRVDLVLFPLSFREYLLHHDSLPQDRQVFLQQRPAETVSFLDCEDPRVLVKLENPMLTLEPLEGLMIIDEIQRRPDPFPVLRVLIDDDKSRRYLILGSASRDLLAQSSETLAGRITYLELGGFHLGEIVPSDLDKLWLLGGFPLSFLVAASVDSAQWREDFIRSFLERDFPQLGIQIPASALRRFWTMLSHCHGQIFNASDLSRSLGVADTTIKRYLDLLTSTFMIRQLQPWFYNTKKRLVKRPKIYFRDSGLLHSFMSVVDRDDLFNHPRLGASWEGFALEQVIHELELQEHEVFFSAAHSGAELDLVFQRKGELWGVEVKYSEAPRRTSSMSAAMKELHLKHLWLVHPGQDRFKPDRQITAVGLQALSAAFQFG